MTRSIMTPVGGRKEGAKKRWSGMGLVEIANPLQNASEVHTEEYTNVPIIGVVNIRVIPIICLFHIFTAYPIMIYP